MTSDLARRRRRLAVVVALAASWSSLPADAGAPLARYRLTIANTNQGQNFSPPVIVLHGAGWRMFELGAPASVELWRLAEDGSTAEFEALADPEISRVLVAPRVHRENSPVVSTTFEAPTDRLISIAAMLSLTNDGFVAARAVPLPAAIGETVTVALRAYDAGSEANTESCAHVPCEVHGRRMTEGAEGAVAEHPGIRGDADIPPGRAWQGSELGRLTITRLPEEQRQ